MSTLTMKDFDFLIMIGRVQPFHDGHQRILAEAMRRAKHAIMLIGSANASRSTRNPFTYEERAEMIRRCFPDEVRDDKLIVAPIDDYPYNDQQWLAHVQRTVQDIVLHYGNGGAKFRLSGMNDFRVGLIGFSKDGTSYYLKKFPQWGSVNVKQEVVYNATNIRDAYFRHAPTLPRDIAPDPVVEYLKAFMSTPEFRDLVEEQKFIEDYKKAWEDSPHPPSFNTVDAVVIQSGHVLLIRRGRSPGRGLLALPGGFINKDETVMEAVVRELKEETQIADHRGEIPPAKLRSLIKSQRLFDAPHRDPRGRVYSHAHLFELPDWDGLFEVKGADDAAEALWMPLGTLDPRQMFLDHYHIVHEMVEEA